MFGGGTSTEYEDIVNKTTDENLTTENWDMILNLCDKVQEEGQTGAHSVIAAILKRLAHRNPNVQLYALSLTESLTKNLGIEIHREIASRAFTQGLEKLIMDRNTHEKVRRRALGLIAMWAAEFENNTDLGLMEDCYNTLKAKNYKFEIPDEPVPPTVDDEARRREEEELQRVLEMSMQDRGGRSQSQWAEYTLAGSSGGAAAAGSSRPGTKATAAPAIATGSSSSASASASTPGHSHPFAQPKYQAGGYVPARTPSPSPSAMAAQQRQQQAQYHLAQAAYAQGQVQAQGSYPQSQSQPQPQSQGGYPSRSSSLSERPVHTAPNSSTPALPRTSSPAPSSSTIHGPSSSGTIHGHSSSSTTAPSSSNPSNPPSSTSSTTHPPLNMNIVTRVRALHTFEPTEPGELAFDKGDVIKVVDRGYKDWWRGQLKGRTGIFPVNYVEPMPEPTATELAREAESEAAVFAQAVNVEKLLNMLRALDPAKDNLADNEEIQELYRSSMALRPKIVKLIDKYSQKRADLVSMNETFVRARTIFDRMMEESLARHSGVYDQPIYRPPPGPQYRPDSAAGGRPGHGQQPGPYGWNAASAALYEGYSAPPGLGGQGQGPAGYGVPVPQAAPGQQQDMQYGAPGLTPTPGQPGYANGAMGVTSPPPQGQLPYGVGAGPYAGGVYTVQPQQQVQGSPQQQGPPQQQQQQQQPQQGPGYGAATGLQPQPQQYQQQQTVPAQGYPQQQSQSQQPPPFQQQQQTPIQVQGYPQQQQQPLPNQALAQAQVYPQQTVQQQPVQVHVQPLSVIGQGQQQPQAQPTLQLPQQGASSPGSPEVQQAHLQPQSQALFEYQVQPQPQPQSVQPQSQPQSVQPQLQPQQAQVQDQLITDTATQPNPASAQPQPQSQPQPQPQVQPASQAQAQPQQPISGPPPYAYDPSYTYADPNVQAWAQYYAQGGKDLAGSVYFLSIPGVTDGVASAPAPTPAAAAGSAQGPGQQGQQGQQTETQSELQYGAAVNSAAATSSAPLGSAAAAARAASPIQQQQQQQRPVTHYQLSDPGFVGQAQAQGQPQYTAIYQPTSSSPSDTTGLNQSLGLKQSSPTSTSFGRPGPGSGHSPSSSTSTPTWVLPKKVVTPGAGGPTTGLANQLGGISLSDQ